MGNGIFGDESSPRRTLQTLYSSMGTNRIPPPKLKGKGPFNLAGQNDQRAFEQNTGLGG